MKEVRWWWLRHAPVPSPEARIHGRLDLPCDTSDTEDFAALARQLPRQAVLLESGLIRCRQTIGALEAAGVPLPPAQLEPDLVEQDFGAWQGHSWSELADAKDPDLPRFWKDPAGEAPPGGESFAQVIARVRGVLARQAEENPHRDIIAVAHAGTIRAALAVALELPPDVALRFAVDPLSLTRIDQVGESWRVVCVNRMPG